MADEQLCERLNKTRLTADDIRQVEHFCYDLVKANTLSQLQNDAKLRAVNSTKTYDEFKDIVDAAHLQPLSRSDKKNANTQSRLWNSIARN
ncbi:coiled-coil domain-containing protein 103 [Sitodiplosis mosellana]|uniref:coiled-coil domain-containing protein 103 n=1 Tax=Sitodiplosis mosellana TaxID=263140 RepID=UPI0024442A02|nr:coiled-coil domain-containing protein 103 [Sitodiplosis mosellana]